jgi:predicted ATPase
LAASSSPLDSPRHGRLARICKTGLACEHDAQARVFAALQWFIERAESRCDFFQLEEIAVPLLASICRRLDGNLPAIKLAAERVDLLGIPGLAASLDQGLHLVLQGRRTAWPCSPTASSP